MRSSKVWNFSTVKPPHPTLCPTTPTYQVNRTCSLSHFPLSVSLSVPHAHKLTFIHCFTLSLLPLHSMAQTSYTSARDVAPLGPRNRRCSAEGPLQIYSVISRTFYLTVLPSLVFAFCLLFLLSLQIFPSPLSFLSDRQLQFILLFFWKELSSFVLLCPNHAFPRPPLTSSSSQPRQA